MSHFLTVVIAPTHGVPPDQLEPEDMIKPLLAAYAEDIQVPEYEEDCYCVGRKAKNDAFDQAVAKFGPFDGLRVSYHALLEKWVEENCQEEWDKALADKDWDKADEIKERHSKVLSWKEHIKEFETYQEEQEKAHPMKGKPKADCEECNGSGRSKSTYNPKSKWDWYMIGGRWSGAFVEDYDPWADRANMEQCSLCKGTGTRPDMDVENGCNGCDGTGIAIKWPTQFKQYKGDVMPVENLPEDIKAFAVLTPDGEWHERGNMGWWGMVSDEEDPEKWAECVKEMLKAHSDGKHVAIAVDCHI